MLRLGALPVAAAAMVVAGCSRAIPLEVVELDEETAAACARLVDALPEQVADQDRREVDTRGIGAAWGDPAIVLLCGVPAPESFEPTSMCTTVDGVDWFIPEEQLEAQGDLVMTVVNRQQHVEVRLPSEYWPPATALADLSSTIAEAFEPTGSCV